MLSATSDLDFNQTWLNAAILDLRGTSLLRGIEVTWDSTSCATCPTVEEESEFGDYSCPRRLRTKSNGTVFVDALKLEER